MTMRKITLLSLLLSLNGFSQYIVNTVYDDGGKHFIYNGSLMFKGNPNSLPETAFAKFDGTTATNVQNPTGNTNLYMDYPMEYNGGFYYEATGNTLGKYDGTTISYVPKVNPTDIGMISKLVLYNNKLNYIYRNAAGLRQLATFDGTSQVIYPNPDAGLSAYSDIFSMYNGNQFFSYVNQNGKTALAKFDGNTITLVTNDNPNDTGIYSSNSGIANNNLIFLYEPQPDYNAHFAKYDGSTITVVPNLPSGGRMIFSKLIEFNNAVYGRYWDSSFKFHLAKYDGTNFTVLPNITLADQGVMDSYFVFKDKLYFRYTGSTGYNLARTDGNTIELLPIKFNGGLDNFYVIVGDYLYFSVIDINNFSTLGRFDGTNLITYTNSTNTNPQVSTSGFTYFNNKVYFIANGKLSYLDQVILANESFQKNDFKIYPNPSNGIVNIETTFENVGAEVEVHNLLGQTVKSFTLNQIQNIISLEKGMYIMIIKKENAKSAYKIIIE